MRTARRHLAIYTGKMADGRDRGGASSTCSFFCYLKGAAAHRRCTREVKCEFITGGLPCVLFAHFHDSKDVHADSDGRTGTLRKFTLNSTAVELCCDFATMKVTLTNRP